MDHRIAYCGVDCSACGDYKTGVCPSCKLTPWTENDICMPVKCCREKGIAFCGQCGGFPCADMAEFYEESEGHAAAYERMLLIKNNHKTGD